MTTFDEAFVLEELSAIREQLKFQVSVVENKEVELKKREVALEERILKLETKEADLTKREAVLFDVEECFDSFYSNISECIHRKVLESVKPNCLLAEKLETSYQRVSKENKRLKESFVTVCSANEKLKNQLETEQMQCSQVKRRLVATQCRLSTFRTKLSSSSSKSEDAESKLCSNKNKQSSRRKTESLCSKEQLESSELDEKVERQLLLNLMQWVHNSLSGINNDSPELLCIQALPILAILLPNVPIQYHYIWLQFTCQILLHLSSKKKLLLSTSLRRIGEVCVTSLMSSQSTRCFCSSSDIHIRILSSIVVLLSLTQVDTIYQILQTLKQDLREPHAIEDDFLSYGGVQALLPYVQPSPKFNALCLSSLDIFILMSSDSGLRHLMNKEWFTAAAELLKKEHSQSTPQILEKLGILLQRLSCIRQSKVLFERSQVLHLLQSLSTSKDLLTSFLQLNICSILANLGD